jgi:hypothetical protein
MKSGSNAGIAVFDRKEPTLRGINANCMYVQYSFFKKNNSHYFWDWLRIYYRFKFVTSDLGPSCYRYFI